MTSINVILTNRDDELYRKGKEGEPLPVYLELEIETATLSASPRRRRLEGDKVLSWEIPILRTEAFSIFVKLLEPTLELLLDAHREDPDDPPGFSEVHDRYDDVKYIVATTKFFCRDLWDPWSVEAWFGELLQTGESLDSVGLCSSSSSTEIRKAAQNEVKEALSRDGIVLDVEELECFLVELVAEARGQS